MFVQSLGVEAATPLFLALAAPVIARLAAWEAASPSRQGQSAERTPAPAANPPALYALPARAAVALAAAARARKR